VPGGRGGKGSRWVPRWWLSRGLVRRGGVCGGDEEWCIGVGTGRVRGPRENRLLDTIL